MKELEVEKNSIENKKQEQEKKKADLKVAKAKAGQMQILMENNKMLEWANITIQTRTRGNRETNSSCNKLEWRFSNSV